MSGTILQSSRLRLFRTPANGGGALYVRPLYPLTILNLGYSIVDTASKLGTTANNLLQTRIAVVVGNFSDDPNNFGITYDLGSYDVKGDFFVNDLGPNVLTFSDQANDGGLTIEPGIGATIIVAAPLITGISGTEIVQAIYAAGKGARGGAIGGIGTFGGNGAAAPTSTSTSGGTSGGTSSGGTSSGSYAGGGTYTGGGATRVGPARL